MKKLYKVTIDHETKKPFLVSAKIVKETPKTYQIESDNYESRSAFDYVSRWNKDRPDTYLTKHEAVKAFRIKQKKLMEKYIKLSEEHKRYFIDAHILF
jgi:hypothetical protein